jgi:uncharacterized protein (DUF302 family)
MYTMGNPAIAETMLKHTIAAGLNVPVRLLIYESQDSGQTKFAYDLPSSLMSILGDDAVNAAAKKLDEKLIALANHLTGADA